jgi:hypothetical protein
LFFCVVPAGRHSLAGTDKRRAYSLARALALAARFSRPAADWFLQMFVT